MEEKQKIIPPLHMYRWRDYKFILVILVCILAVLGIFMVASARPDLRNRQTMGVIFGVVVMLIVSVIDYHYLLNLYWIAYVLNLLLLVAVHIFGEESNGATRWLNIGIVQFQPSDLTKIIIILFFARFLSGRKVSSIKTIASGCALIVPSLLLIYKQPNLSNTICLAALFAALFFVAGINYKIVIGALAIIIPLGILLFVIAIQPNQKIIDGYQQNRILAWLEPDKYQSAEAYQQLNSIMAIGSGELTGKGYNTKDSSSVKNGNFISEPQTDFIFAIIGEELGFVGCCIVIFLLLLVTGACAYIGHRSKDLEGRIVCGGVSALIGIQTLINISVATMVFPNTGLSLPFISYGLTSIVCFFIGIGFVLNVGLQPER